MSTIPSVTRNELIANLFVAATNLDASLNAKLGELANILATEVAGFDLPLASKLALLESAYKDDFKLLAVNRNTVASLRAALTCKVAGGMLVEVKAPSKDGKVGAVLKPADKLSVGEAKKFAAVVKADAAEAERSPEEAQRAEQLEKSMKAAAQEVSNKLATAVAQAKAEEAFAYVLHDARRATLTAKLAAIGYKLAKLTTAPTK